MTQFLVSSVYKIQGKDDKYGKIVPDNEATHNVFKEAKASIDDRKPVKIWVCHILFRYCRPKRERKLYELGEDRLSKNLDVLSFLKAKLAVQSLF